MFSVKLIKETIQISRRLSSLSINKTPNQFIRSSISTTTTTPTIVPHQLCLQNNLKINFQPQSISLEIIPTSIKPSIENPLINNIISIENPINSNSIEITEQPTTGIDQSFELPATIDRHGEDGMQAIVMIGVRKRKMKKHKLKKLRKKMKFEWAKVRQRRELRKEKAFQAILINQIKEAEKFSAEDYVNEKIRKANEIIIPRFWKGRRLPTFIIKEKMGLK